jgi:hypothetical protein
MSTITELIYDWRGFKNRKFPAWPSGPEIRVKGTKVSHKDNEKNKRRVNGTGHLASAPAKRFSSTP